MDLRMKSLREKYNDEEWNWKLRVAFMFILGHLVVLILPFFSVMFLLMDLLEGGSHVLRQIQPLQALGEGLLLISLIGVFFSEMISMFGKTFTRLVGLEVGLLVTFFLTSSTDFDMSGDHHIIPPVVISTCAAVKVCLAYWSSDVDKLRKDVMNGRRPGKIV